jgi:hypothetical protein
MITLLSLCVALPIYLDSRRPIPERVQDLIDNMTLDEKVGQDTEPGICFLNPRI